jgi:DNA-binding MarR family transcriptional regulator
MGDRWQVFHDLIRLETELWETVDERLRTDVGLPLSWLEPMRIVDRMGTGRVNDIADALSITVGGTSKLVDRIEADGLCTRRPNPDDRRSSLISLTPEGERCLSVAVVALDDELAGRFDLPDTTLDKFHATLRRLRANLRARPSVGDHEQNT